jgi:hypothetical protein
MRRFAAGLLLLVLFSVQETAGAALPTVQGASGAPNARAGETTRDLQRGPRGTIDSTLVHGVMPRFVKPASTSDPGALDNISKSRLARYIPHEGHRVEVHYPSRPPRELDLRWSLA